MEPLTIFFIGAFLIAVHHAWKIERRKRAAADTVFLMTEAMREALKHLPQGHYPHLKKKMEAVNARAREMNQ